LILLRDVWGLSSWIPPILPRRKLEQEILNIFTADLLLKSEASVDSMSDEDIGQLCLARCMFEVGSQEERKASVKNWIDVSSTLADMKSKSSISSVVCHLPWVMREEYSTEGTSSADSKH
jgi:hypothetical protein